MGKIVQVSETERKYVTETFSKEDLWDREFLIYQWYDKDDPEYKIKCIFDLTKLTSKWVSVKKNRISNETSKKTVTYFCDDEINPKSFLGWPFVCKRRSLKGDISIDFFIRSNNHCRYLIENEGDDAQLQEVIRTHNIGLKDVTDDVSYRNTNLTTEFLPKDLDGLLLMLSVICK